MKFDTKRPPTYHEVLLSNIELGKKIREYTETLNALLVEAEDLMQCEHDKKTISQLRIMFMHNLPDMSELK